MLWGLLLSVSVLDHVTSMREGSSIFGSYPGRSHWELSSFSQRCLLFVWLDTETAVLRRSHSPKIYPLI